MSIAKKTILMIIGITTALFLLVYLASNFIYLKGFETLEYDQVRRNIERVENAINLKLNTLDVFCHDWSSWDDTYYFALGQNPEYVDKNLADDTFVNSDISIFLVLNTQGEIMYGKAYDIINAVDTPLPEDLPAFLSSPFVKQSHGTQRQFMGVTTLSNQPLMFTSRPIYTSQNEGPAAGYLMVGRYIDAAIVKSITVTTQFPVEIFPVQNIEQGTEMSDALNSLRSSGATYIKTSKATIDGYGDIKDITGTSVLLYKVAIPRDIYDQGARTIGYLHVSLFAMAIVFSFILVLFIKRLILSRLTALTNAVNSIGSKGEISNRVQIKGNDELSRLSENINNMLESLEVSEARRQSQKEVISHIVTITPNGIVAINDTGNITLLNDAFREMFDLKNRSMLDVKLEDLPDMSDIAVELNNFRLSRMASFRKEIHRVRNGAKKIYIAHFARLKEEELYILYLTDISEERQKQESLYLTDRLASIGEMASGIAHELNNPLTSIIGLSEIVMRDEVPESVKEDMGMIKSESHRAANIVRNLLSFARRNATLKQPANINKIISDVLRLRSYEHGVNNIKIVKDLDTTLPDILIDHSQIQQVFINIILNAEYAMTTAHGKGILKVKTEIVDNMLRTSFIDDGPGIEPGNLRHIFDPFFTTKEVGKGTGLGLSISFGIVTAHNGRIYATSEIDKGATFVVDLPLSNSAAREVKQNA